MGCSSVIRYGDVQVMIAGTGIQHSEFNPNKDKPLKLLQIWVFPNKRNVSPRYDQITLNMNERHNKLQQILSPFPEDEGVWIHQDAWFHLGKFDKDLTAEYEIKKNGNGVYAFVIRGAVMIEGELLNERDGLGIWETDNLSIQFVQEGTEILLMEVPMAG